MTRTMTGVSVIGDAPESLGAAGARSSRAARWLWRLALANLVANIGIVLTGGAVRLTGSGLGCPTWPRCTEESYVVHGELGLHGAIEFGNRMVTFLVAAVAVACLVAAVRTRVRRASRLALTVALGVPAQALIGGVTVQTGLNPWVVALHLLVSMAIIGVCVWLLKVAGDVAGGAGTRRLAVDGDGATDQRSARLRLLAWLTFATGWAVLYLGTVVTGSGPHSGDLDSRRTGLDPERMSHAHAAAVYLLVALTLTLLALSVRSRAQALSRAAALLLLVELAQAAVGFAQYFLGLPEGLVALHLLGAALTSAALAHVVLCAHPGAAASGGHRAHAASRASTATATKSRLR